MVEPEQSELGGEKEVCVQSTAEYEIYPMHECEGTEECSYVWQDGGCFRQCRNGQRKSCLMLFENQQSKVCDMHHQWRDLGNEVGWSGAKQWYSQIIFGNVDY